MRYKISWWANENGVGDRGAITQWLPRQVGSGIFRHLQRASYGYIAGIHVHF